MGNGWVTLWAPACLGAAQFLFDTEIVVKNTQIQVFLMIGNADNHDLQVDWSSGPS